MIIFGIIVGFSINHAYAELDANNAYVLEGSGFVVSDSEIKDSQIDFALITEDISNGRGDISIRDGFFTLDNSDYTVGDIDGNILHDGKFLRFSGTSEDSSGKDVEIRAFGRLIEDNPEGSVYSFTGRIIEDNTEYKILYTSKISIFSQSPSPSNDVSDTTEESEIVRILLGSNDRGLGASYIDKSRYTGTATQASYFSPSRIAIEPGNSITFVNEDIVSHTIVSGSGSSATTRGAFVLCSEVPEELPEGHSYRQSNCSYTLDGRVNTGEILPGESAVVTFEEAGFYTLIDPDYPWMSITAYSYNDVGSMIIRQGNNQLGN